MSGPEINPRDDEQPTKEEWEAWERQHQEEEDDDPPCECVRVDVDEDDSSGCPLHGPHGPLARIYRENEAEAERAAAARIPILLGEDWS